MNGDLIGTTHCQKSEKKICFRREAERRIQSQTDMGSDDDIIEGATTCLAQ